MPANAAGTTVTTGTIIQPTLRGREFFERTQDWQFRLLAWDTPQTVLAPNASGVLQATEGLQLRVYEPKAGTSWASYVSALTGVVNGASPNTAFTNTALANELVSDGRCAVAQAYWGGGTPNWWGGTQPGQIAVSYRGKLVSATRRSWLTAGTSFVFAAAGSGQCRIDLVTGGSRTTVMPWTTLTEGNFLTTGFAFSSSATLTEEATDIEIFYVQTGSEPWGGLVVKAIPGTVGTNALAADAPVVSGGLFAYGTLAPVELPFIISAKVDQEVGAATRLAFEVPLINRVVNDGNGWLYDRVNDQTDPGRLRLYTGSTTPVFDLRRKRLVQLQVALKSSTPNWKPIFTGHVHDFESGSSGKLTVQCLGYESRLVEQYEQVPDRISYMGRGFRTVDFFATDAVNGEPVYNIPAFDHWPLAWAVEELGVRAGIDPSCFRQPWTELQANGSAVQVTLPWTATPKRFRADSLTGTKVNVPRPVNYGNAGVAFTETRPFDDDYVFQVEATKDLWARSRELTDKMGYVWRFDETGAAVLYPANVPSFVQDLTPAQVTSGTATEITNPSAYGAKYLQATGAVTLSTTVTTSRIDIAFPRQFNARPWVVSVARSSAPGTPLLQVTVSPGSGLTSLLTNPYLLFSAPTTARGENASLVTVFSGDYDTYVVTLTSAAVTGQTAYIDCLLCYPVDPDNSVFPTFSTLDTALSVTTRPQQDATRNKVTIVGRRKGSVTDSDKFAEAQAPTDQEFVVANAVDVDSITNPAATNYVGFLKQSVIYDNSISDDGFAQYLAQVFIYRNRNPQPGTSVTHPLLPVIRLGEPVSVSETKFDTTKALTGQYVRKLNHSLERNRFQTTLETESWPEYPAYQPRTDINLAAFGNSPVTSLAVTYPTLSGHTVTNPTDGTDSNGTWVNTVSETYVYTATATVGAGTPPALNLPGGAPWPPVPGTVQIMSVDPVTNPPGTATSTTGSLTAAGWVLEQWAVGTRVLTIPLPADAFVTSLTSKFEIGNVGAGSWSVLKDDPSGVFYYTLTENSVVVYRGRTQTRTSYEDLGKFTVTVNYISSAEDIRSSVWRANTPYHQFINVNYLDAATPKMTLPFAQARGHGRSSLVGSYTVRYRPLFPVSGSDPNTRPAGVANDGDPFFSAFYDPYTSELGHVVNVSMDVLANGLYRVSVRSRYDDTIVAWLTNPQADVTKAEQHWEYIPITAGKTFTWDGVDQLGEWNAAQSVLYEKLVGGAFDANQPARVGKGYYVWNREVSGAALGPLAYIWMKRDAAGKPIIGHGTYAAWYVCVEAVSDAIAASKRSTVKSAGSILTHLPEPTKVELKVQDYAYSSAAGTGTVGVSNGIATFSASQSLTAQQKITAGGTTFRIVSGSGTSYAVTPSTVTVAGGTSFTIQTGSWQAVTTAAQLVSAAYPSQTQLAATIDSSKPVRVRFRVADRPGYWWTNKREQITVKLTREVHLRAVIGDQVVRFAGKEIPGTAFEERSVYNRRLVNDEHTKQYRDSGYRKANTLKWDDGDAGVTEWVFFPTDFKSDFRIAGLDEAIGFGNYLQLEEVPGWSSKRDIASARARLQFALVSYLFYLSAYITDRSGRSSWGINREYVDQSKITDNTTALDWPDDPMYQQRRSIICRQWTNEDNWVSSQRSAFSVSTANTLFEALLQHWWWQHEITATTIGTAQTTWTSYGLTTDHYSHAHRPGGVSNNLRLPAVYGTTHRQLGRVSGASGANALLENHLWKTTTNTLATGAWSWETGPAWVPSITRDLHPYFLLPPMVSPAKDGTIQGIEVAQNTRNLYTTTSGDQTQKIRLRTQVEVTKVDAAAAETWSSGAYEMSAMRDAPTNPSNRIRWWPNQAVDTKTGVFKDLVDAYTILYVRQDETVHYEDLRGIYSRGKYPTAQPIKVVSGSPYYLNQGRYYGIRVGDTIQESIYPLFHVVENTAASDDGLRLEWFRQAFRSEYVWESGSLFPCTMTGAEKLEAVLWWRTRFLGPESLKTVFYDYGAWTGWKDDLGGAVAAVQGGVQLASGALGSPFLTRHMPVGVGPVLKTTYELVAHLVLVNERRGGA